MFRSFEDISKLGLLGHILDLCLTLWGNCQRRVFLAAVLVPTSSMSLRGPGSPLALIHLLDYGHPSGCQMVPPMIGWHPSRANHDCLFSYLKPRWEGGAKVSQSFSLTASFFEFYLFIFVGCAGSWFLS